MPRVDCIYFVWRAGEANTGYNPESGICLRDGQVPACTHCLRYDPKPENLKEKKSGAWDCSDRDPVQDLIDTFWTKNPQGELEKFGNEWIKRMISKERWPEEQHGIHHNR